MRTEPYIPTQKPNRTKEQNPLTLKIMRAMAIVVAFVSVFAFFIKILFL